jgi:hypothetical protein
MDQADKAVRSECRQVARDQGGEMAIETTIVDPEGLGSGKHTPGAAPDGWIDPKNVDDSPRQNPMGGCDYGTRRFGPDENVAEDMTSGNPNHEMYPF